MTERNKKPENFRAKSPRPKAVMLSRRANIFYLEHAKLIQEDGKVVYLTSTGADIEKSFNIPDKNTAFILLGNGTSITNSAARKLAESNVTVGFCSGGGSPLFSAVDIAFLTSQDEYRPTQYMQAWAEKWFSEEKRLDIARKFLRERMKWTSTQWTRNGIIIPESYFESLEAGIQKGATANELLSAEAYWAKRLYALLARTYGIGFTREEGKKSRDGFSDKANSFLDHGNYIAYGYAASALHGLGVSFSFPVLHGKTRRGALVFDVADLIKDGLVMPLAFKHAKSNGENSAFRAELIEKANDLNVLDFLMNFIIECAEA